MFVYPRDNYFSALSSGEARGKTVFHQFGVSSAAGTGIIDVWSQNSTYTYLSSAATMYVSSANGADDKQITVEGLDGNYKLQRGVATLNGQSQVEVKTSGGAPMTFLRVFNAWNSDSADFSGTVYVAESDTLTGGVPNTASKIKAIVGTTAQKTTMALFTVPAGMIGLIHSWRMSVYKDTTVLLKGFLFVRETGKVFRGMEQIALSAGGMPNAQFRFDAPLFVPSKADVAIRCQSSAASTFVYGLFCIELRPSS